jgi:nitric oxide reductase activation protein
MDSSLLKSSLPTDNLYKFLALCGTAVLALSIWSSQQNAHDHQTHSRRLATRFREVADGIQSLGDLEKILVRDGDGNVLALQTVGNAAVGNPVYATPTDKEALRRFLQVSDAMLFEWAKVPFDNKDKDAWFAMTDVAEHTKRRLGLDDTQYQKYVEQLSLEEFRILRQPGNARAAELRVILNQLEGRLAGSMAVPRYARATGVVCHLRLVWRCRRSNHRLCVLVLQGTTPSR